MRIITPLGGPRSRTFIALGWPGILLYIFVWLPILAAIYLTIIAAGCAWYLGKLLWYAGRASAHNIHAARHPHPPTTNNWGPPAH